MASSFGTSVATTLWNQRASMLHAHFAESTSRDGVATAEALATLERMVDQQACTLSAKDLFYGSALLFVMLAGFVWLARPLPAHP